MDSLPVGIQFVGAVALISEVIGGVVAIVLIIIAVKIGKKFWKKAKEEGLV